LVSWRWARCALHMQRAGNEASVGECLRQSATSESVAAVGRAQRCSGKRARVIGSNYGRRRRCSGRGWRCEVSWRSAADEIGPHFWWLAKGTERGIGIVFGCYFARQRIIRTSTRCPSTIRRDALPCGRSCTHSSQHAHSQFQGRLRGRTTVSGAASVLLARRRHARSHSTPTPRAPPSKRRGQTARAGGCGCFKTWPPWYARKLPFMRRSTHILARLDLVHLTHCFILLERRGGARTGHSARTHARNTHNTSCPPASRLLAHTCALLAHCAPTAQALSPHRRNNMWSITHHAPDR
jgi:hypothetical protein